MSMPSLPFCPPLAPLPLPGKPRVIDETLAQRAALPPSETREHRLKFEKELAADLKDGLHVARAMTHHPVR